MITKDMTIAKALEIDPEIATILMKQGMHCVFCGAAAAETIEQACQVHEITEERMFLMLLEINRMLEAKNDIEARRAAILAEEDEEDDI